MTTGVVQPKLVGRERRRAARRRCSPTASRQRLLQAADGSFPAAVAGGRSGAAEGRLPPVDLDRAAPGAAARCATSWPTTYLPAARDSVGLQDMKGGPAALPLPGRGPTRPRSLTPDQIHQIGPRRGEAASRRDGEGQGRRSASPARCRSSSSTSAPTPSSSRHRANGCSRDMSRSASGSTRRLPRLFSTLPKAPLDIRPVPALTEKGAARGSTIRARPTDRGPACSIFNAYDLPSRTTPGDGDAVPARRRAGASLPDQPGAGERARCPTSSGSAATPLTSRAGALYAETLGRELGVYTDPYQYFGYLDSQLFRAIRLVVDTGIHSKGWTRDQTIQYILDNSSRGRSNATAETERYIANPGPGARLQDRPAEDQRAAREGRARARPEVRHPRFPRAGADERSAAAGGPGAEDRPLDRGEEG